MSEIQRKCIYLLITILAVINIVGWFDVYWAKKEIRRALLCILIPLDVVVTILLILGAIGVFG